MTLTWDKLQATLLKIALTHEVSLREGIAADIVTATLHAPLPDGYKVYEENDRWWWCAPGVLSWCLGEGAGVCRTELEARFRAFEHRRTE